MTFCARLWLLAIPLAGLAACSVAPSRMPVEAEQPVRTAAREFTLALRNADAARLSELSAPAIDSQTRQLTDAVLADALTARQVQLQLEERFHRTEDRPAIVGSDSWIDQFEQTAARGEIWQAGDRVRIGDAGRDGTLFLRHQANQWKVEIVPSLVAESGGRTRLSDPVVDYRFNTTRAVNQHFLARLGRNEFASFHDYLQAKNQFWFQYMTCAAAGDDPHDKLLDELPPLPAEPLTLAIDR